MVYNLRVQNTGKRTLFERRQRLAERRKARVAANRSCTDREERLGEREKTSYSGGAKAVPVRGGGCFICLPDRLTRSGWADEDTNKESRPDKGAAVCIPGGYGGHWWLDVPRRSRGP